MKHFLFTRLAVLTLACTPLLASAWSQDGHVLIVDLAMDQIDSAQSRELESIARELETRFDFDRRMVNLRAFGSSNDVAKIASFPDWIRDEPLGQLFQRFDARLPAALEPLADQDTSSWHYTNQAINEGSLSPSSCQVSPEWDVVRVIPLLQQAWQQADSKIAQALVLSFLVHMIGDIHQPMHTITRVSENCRHDLGGNLFCATRPLAAGRCPQSLHALWDTGVGLFDRYDEYPALKQALDSHMPEQFDPDMRLDSWLAEGLAQSRLAYSIRENQSPDPTYLEDGRYVSAGRISLAAQRLSLILEDLDTRL